MAEGEEKRFSDEDGRSQPRIVTRGVIRAGTEACIFIVAPFFLQGPRHGSDRFSAACASIGSQPSALESCRAGESIGW